MGRVLVLIVLVVAAVWLIRRALRPKPPQEAKDVPQSKAIEADLVSCAHCGLNLPRGEALTEGAGLYCSQDHARKGPAPRPPR